MPDLSTAIPTRKVTAGVIVGSFCTIVFWITKAIWKLEVPAEAAVAITTIATFCVSYMTHAHARDLRKSK